jgi:hypothetical protein
LLIEDLQDLLLTVLAPLLPILFMQRFVVFLALEHLCRHFCWHDAGTVGGAVAAAAAVVVVTVVEAYVGGGGGAGDAGRRCCIFYLGDGVLDEAGRGGFVDCELACAVDRLANR